MTGLTRADKPAPKGRRGKKLTRAELKKRGLKPIIPGEHTLDVERALNLRLAGMTHEQIAKTMGKSKTRVQVWIQDAVYGRIKEPSDLIRQLEIQRLDAMTLSLASKVRAGDVQAIDRQLKIMERKSKLLGLDMAEKKDIGGSLEFQWRIDERRRPDDPDPSPDALPETSSVR